MFNPNGVYRAVIHDLSDPAGLGRAKMLVPAIYGSAVSGWAAPVFAGSGSKVGDAAWVSFENADLNRPVWMARAPMPADHIHGQIAYRAPTARPEEYPDGHSMFEVGAQTGWPTVLGTVVTEFASVNRASQMFLSKANNIYQRTADTAMSGGWTDWRMVSFSDHLHDDRYLRTGTLAQGNGVPQYVRIARVDGSHPTQGRSLSLLISGGGTIGAANRHTDLVHFVQRNTDTYGFTAWRFGSAVAIPWTYHVKQISSVVFELWAYRTGYDAALNVTSLSPVGAQVEVLLDSHTSSAPSGLIAQPAPLLVGGRLGAASVSPGTNVTTTSTTSTLRDGVAVVNVNATATAALSTGATLFTLPDEHRPASTTFGTLMVTSDNTPRRVDVFSSGAAVVGSAVASGSILRGQIVIPLP